MTTSPRQVRDDLARHGLRPRRALGQNFVTDPNTVRRVARLAGVGPDTPVVEIGAGLGALTTALAETGADVVAVEVDEHLVPLLRARVEPLGVRVVGADALTLDWARLLAGVEGPWTLVGNLPYNVAVPVVARALDEAPAVGSLLVMVQREVGERLVAEPGSRTYGAVSVKVAYHATARIVGDVPATVFLPRPKVASVLVHVVRRPSVAVDPVEVDPARLFALVRAGFGQRRKMLRRSLAGLVPPECFAAADIDPAARAESLSVQDWGEAGGVRPGAVKQTAGGATVLSAPAKLTLSLRVTGVRPDGYHLLDAEMVGLDLADTLVFGPGSGVTVVDEVVGGLGIGDVAAGPANLVARALDAVERKAAVRVVKRIPVGAGLGGGSADAAAVLRWARCDDTAVATQLGADVPFCLRGGRARVRGIGEVVDDLPFEERRFVLVLPPLALSTAAVYAAWDARGAMEGAELDGPGGNDLERAALDVAPELARWRDSLAEVTGVRPRLAGSGSTWFVEGDLRSVGLEERDVLEVDGQRAPVLAVRTVPAAAPGA